MFSEAVGVVEEAPGNECKKGDVVATAMGGPGRMFDGGYAQFASVPAAQIQVIKTQIAWETLGAIPEMLQTAWGSLFTSLRLQTSDRLLIHGGTTSVGLAAAAIAKNHGAYVAATTCRSDREDLLRATELIKFLLTMVRLRSRSNIIPAKVLTKFSNWFVPQLPKTRSSAPERRRSYA